MTRPVEDYIRVRALSLRHNRSEIARFTGIPRGTVKQWLLQGPPNYLDDAPLCNGSCQPEPPAAAYAYLLGTYLGDGYVSEAGHRNLYNLRIACDGIYPAIIAEIRAAMEAVSPKSPTRTLRMMDYRSGSKQPSRGVTVYSYSKHWPCFFPQYGPARSTIGRSRCPTGSKRSSTSAPNNSSEGSSTPTGAAR